jgi:cell wall assembly regulator SMI1
MAEIHSSLRYGPATPQQIAALEERIEASLPDDYREFLQKHNGGRPEPDAFALNNDVDEDEEEDEGEEDIVLCFFPLRDVNCRQAVAESEQETTGPEERLAEWPLHCAWEDLQADLRRYDTELGQRILPIGTDGCGNYIAIALDDEKTGRIVFYDHEEAGLRLLAPSFTSFLAALRPRERYGLE